LDVMNKGTTTGGYAPISKKKGGCNSSSAWFCRSKSQTAHAGRRLHEVETRASPLAGAAAKARSSRQGSSARSSRQCKDLTSSIAQLHILVRITGRTQGIKISEEEDELRTTASARAASLSSSSRPRPSILFQAEFVVRPLHHICSGCRCPWRRPGPWVMAHSSSTVAVWDGRWQSPP
jgi:hypothetical protein